MKYHNESSPLSKHLLNQLILKVLLISMKLITSRPPSDLLFERTAFFSLCCLLRHIKFQKMYIEIKLDIAYKTRETFCLGKKNSANNGEISLKPVVQNILR